MRLAFLSLVAVNLLFMAWSHWIDPPRQPPSLESATRLPRLLLVTEAPPTPRSADGTTQPMALREEQGLENCKSVGPFNDMPTAARTAAMLMDRGFAPQQRAEEGETVEGYWVFVGGMRSDDDVQHVVERLEKSGFNDAHVMKDSPEGRRVSVGLFSKRERAERRAVAVKRMGLDPEIAERKFPGTVYWVDVGLRDSGRALPADILLADVGASKIGTQACPPGIVQPPLSGPGEETGGQPGHAPEGVAGQGTAQEARAQSAVRSTPAALPRTKIASAPREKGP